MRTSYGRTDRDGASQGCWCWLGQAEKRLGVSTSSIGFRGWGLGPEVEGGGSAGCVYVKTGRLKGNRAL